jgi:hypothetical protein
MNRTSSEGSVALGAVAARAEWLAVACRKCERKGRLRLAGLLERYGADYPMPQLRRDLAGDCPRLRADTQMMDLCDAHFPELAAILNAGQLGLVSR